MIILIKISQLLLSLSILVFIHELGHFFFARLFKMRVDKFYVCFNPYGSLFKAKKIDGKWKFKWFARNDQSATRPKLDENGMPVLDTKGKPEQESIPLEELPADNWNKYPETTEWGLGWLPLGGYCKISGMVDESMDKEQMKQEPKPWEFRSKPAWQRLFVMIGGVMFNIILAMVIYWGMLYTWGDSYIANSDVKNGITCSPLAQEIGFRNGDKVIALDGKSVEKFNDIQLNIIRDGVKTVEVDRNGQRELISIADTMIGKILKTKGFLGIRSEFIASGVKPDSDAESIGLLKDDRIIAVNSQPVKYTDEASKIFQENKGGVVSLQVLRNTDTLVMQAPISETGSSNIICDTKIDYTSVKYGFFEAFPAGIAKGVTELKNYVKDLGLIFSPQTKAYESVGSFITIGSIFPEQWNWQIFWSFSAMLSIMLAVINILPIPALDGGHVVFVLYEMIFRRKPSDKFLEYAQMFGLIILLGIMIFALHNDIMRFIIK